MVENLIGKIHNRVYRERPCDRCSALYMKNKLMTGDDVCDTCERMSELTFWYPKLFRLGLPMPKTLIIHNLVDLHALAWGEKPVGLDSLCEHIHVAAAALGFPAFLRTGFLAAKHSWDKSCFLTKDSNIEQHLYVLAEASALASIDRFVPCDFIVVREMLQTESFFNYFPGNMPITKERRFFVRNGKVECHHPYWPSDIFPDKDEKVLHELNILTAEEEKELIAMATYISKCFSGFWSCDFLKTKKGWYLTDMAIGERSYHQEHSKAVSIAESK